MGLRPAAQGDQVNGKAPISRVVVVTKKVGKYNNNRVIVSSFSILLSRWVKSYPSECSVGFKLPPGQKYYKFHEPDSDEIIGNLYDFRV